MNAAVSGRAGLALLSTDDGLATLHVGEPDRVLPRSAAEVRHLLQSYGDFDFIEGVELDEVRQELRSAWEANEALDLVLIMLDPELSGDVRTRAMGAVEEMVAAEHVARHLRHTLYAAPLPSAADVEFAVRESEAGGYVGVAGLFAQLLEDQNLIRRVRQAFDRSYGGTSAQAPAPLRALTRAGVFVRMVRWVSSDLPRSSAVDLLQAPGLADAAELEWAVARWMAALRPPLSVVPEEPIVITGNETVRVLVCDADEALTGTSRRLLADEGYDVLTASRGDEALGVVQRFRPDIVLTELTLPDIDGLTLLREIRSIAPETLVLILTGFATVDSSVAAVRAGAWDYVPKPVSTTHMRILVERAAREVRRARDNALLRKLLRTPHDFANIIGTGGAMLRVFSLVSGVAPTGVSVFITGESGTGKELIARTIHERSRRADGPFVVFNCAALPGHLAEAEMFGVERIAFSGADAPLRGLLEKASGGTLFLDEITELGPELQARLLRAMQDGRTRRMGGESEISVDVRWIAATSRDPEQAVREGTLRQDLFYRLSVIPIRVPPLRERREDIPALANHFLRRYAQEYNRGDVRFSAEALRVLSDFPWPGNVRELQNTVERAVVMSAPGQPITPRDLPDHLAHPSPELTFPGSLPYREARRDAITLFEREYLLDLLRRHNGNISQVARMAGLDRATIKRKLAQLRLAEYEDFH